MMRALLALLLMVVALGVASAQERTDAPASIPLPEVASRAERVMADLRQLDALLVRPPEVEAIERELPPVVVRLRERSEETTLGLAAAPSLTVLDALVDGWEGARQALLEWVDRLTRRARARAPPGGGRPPRPRQPADLEPRAARASLGPGAGTGP